MTGYLREELSDLQQAGCEFVQFDEPVCRDCHVRRLRPSHLHVSYPRNPVGCRHGVAIRC